MQYQWLNDGNPYPAGHRRAGEYCIAVDFEDGRPEPQNIYLPDKGEAALQKIIKMYASTQVRNAELAGSGSYGRQTETPAPGTTQPPAATTGRMTTDQRMQAVADIEDPAKAPAAIAALLKESPEEIQKEAVRKAGLEVAAFMRDNPDYPATPRNARYLRDRVFANMGGTPLQAAKLDDYQKAFDELTQEGVLESVPSSTETPAATASEEPPAPRQTRPRASTGSRPSSFHGGSGPAPGGPGLALKDILDMAGTDEYVDRRRNDPAFRTQVDQVLAANGY